MLHENDSNSIIIIPNGWTWMVILKESICRKVCDSIAGIGYKCSVIIIICFLLGNSWPYLQFNQTKTQPNSIISAIDGIEKWYCDRVFISCGNVKCMMDTSKTNANSNAVNCHCILFYWVCLQNAMPFYRSLNRKCFNDDCNH